MLLRLPAADARVVSRGIIVLVLLVGLGVMVVEKQLNNLTEQADYVQVLNIRRDVAGYYHAHLFGHSTGVRAVYPLAGIDTTGRSLTLAAANRKITIPTVVHADLTPASYWLDVWRRQFAAEATRTKRELVGYWEQIKPYFRQLADAIRR